MQRATRLLAAVLFGIALWSVVAGAHPGRAQALTGACSVSQAQDDLVAARRALERAERRLAEARFVLAATTRYTTAYGASVGRWVRLARRVSWPKAQFPTLMFVIYRESGGDPYAQNPSGAAGLLQLMPIHWSGRFDPYYPRSNLA